MNSAIDTLDLYQLMLKPKSGTELSLQQWQDAVFILREAKVLGSLYHAAIRNNCFDSYPKAVQRHIYSAHVYAKRQATQIGYEAKELQKLFEQVDVTAIFLKGAGYTLRHSVNGFGRVCSDLDVLVTKQDLTKAETHLKSNRWRSEELSDYDEKYYREWAHEVPPMFQINRATVLDMHHNIYPPISGRAPSVEQFFDSREQTESGCFVLDPACTILHSAVHMFTNEDSSSWMRDLLDIILLLEEFGDEDTWQKLMKLALDINFAAELAFCIAAVKYYSNLELPNAADEFISDQKFNFLQTWLMETVFINAIVPEHDSVNKFKNRLAKQVVYFRGHWIKMPVPILIKHFAIKSFLAIRDKVLGKHHFDPKLPQNPNW